MTFPCMAVGAIAFLTLAATPGVASELRRQPGVELELPTNGHVVGPIRAPPRTKGAEDADLVAGFPRSLGSPVNGQPYVPTLLDVDGDGAAEIFLTGQETFALRGNGSFLAGWPTSEHTFAGYGTLYPLPGPSVADLDGDGKVEVLWTLRDWFAGGSALSTFNVRKIDGGDYPGFPRGAPDQPSDALFGTFVVGDVDRNGSPDHWATHARGGGHHTRLSGFAGSELRGTLSLPENEIFLALYFGDLDGDRIPEMFAVSYALGDARYRLHWFAHEPVPREEAGSPVTLLVAGQSYATLEPPVPFDLDHDGDLEILFGHNDAGQSRIDCVHHLGGRCQGFPLDRGPSTQILSVQPAYLHGGQSELVVVEKDLERNDFPISVLELPSGRPRAGWPLRVPALPQGFVTLFDADGDRLQDVVFVCCGGEVRAVAHDARPLAGFPKQMGSPSISGVAAGDIDGDGRYEMVAATWDGVVYAWNTPSRIGAQTGDWLMHGIDARNTGVFGQVTCTPDAFTLCLPGPASSRQFLVEVDYATTQGAGLAGRAHAVPLASVGLDNGGAFWFFGAANPELMVKVLDGCAVNGHFWIFYSAGTNVGFSVSVIDTVTGHRWLSSNPDLHLAPPVATTTALPCSASSP